MAKIHGIVRKYTCILKWLPMVNIPLLLYWLFRTVFIRRQMPPFGACVKTVAISLAAAIAGALLAQYVLPALFTNVSQQHLTGSIMPLIAVFVIIPAFITLFSKAEAI